MQREVSWKISSVGFISTILIFLHHANLVSFVSDIPVSKVVIMDSFSWLALFAMSWFVFISAYLFFRKFELGVVLHKLRTRVYSLVVPFMIWNTIGVVLKMLNHKRLFLNGILGFVRENYLFLNETGVADGPFWFVFRLLTYIICAPLIYYI